MALFKIFKGNETAKLVDSNAAGYRIPTDGYAYYDTSTKLFYIDADYDENGTITRSPINAESAWKLKNTGRLTDANITHSIDGSLVHFKASSSMTENKPMGDGNILHFNWDGGTNNQWDAQLYVPDSHLNSMQWRAHTSGTDWGAAWKTLLDSDNYTTYTVKKDGTGATGTWPISITGNASTATLPLGFSSQSTNATWGNTTGTTVTAWNDSSGGSIDFRKDNPSSGKLSIKVDGRFYGNEGTYPAMLMNYNNGYWGLGSDPDGGYSGWVRAPASGILTNAKNASSVGSGVGSIGAIEWRFANVYADTLHGSADMVDSWHRDDIRKGCLSFTRNINSANPTDLNTLNDGMAYNYSSTNYWANAPSGASYGSAIALTSGGSVALGGQFFWDVTHNSSSSTRNLYFRAANNLGWQNDWKQVVLSDNNSYAISITGSAATASSATTGKYLWSGSANPVYGTSRLEYFNATGTAATPTANATAFPTSDWYHFLRMNHGNSQGYYVEIASCFHNNNMYWRRVAAGTAYPWCHVWLQGNSVTGAVWNDYAEYREATPDSTTPGYVVFENGDDTLSLTTERLQHFAGITSDTWGFAQGETEKAKTPIAVSGRVLAYTYRDRNEYKPGDCVCAAPGGTIDIMTREEIHEWPDRIVGTVSCVPEYDEWGGGELADRPPVKVNGRIWIRIR